MNCKLEVLEVTPPAKWMNEKKLERALKKVSVFIKDFSYEY